MTDQIDVSLRNERTDDLEKIAVYMCM